MKGPKGETTACRDGADGTLQITVISTVSFGSLIVPGGGLDHPAYFKDGKTEGIIGLKARYKSAAHTVRQSRGFLNLKPRL